MLKKIAKVFSYKHKQITGLISGSFISIFLYQSVLPSLLPPSLPPAVILSCPLFSHLFSPSPQCPPTLSLTPPSSPAPACCRSGSRGQVRPGELGAQPLNSTRTVWPTHPISPLPYPFLPPSLPTYLTPPLPRHPVLPFHNNTSPSIWAPLPPYTNPHPLFPTADVTMPSPPFFALL